MNTFSPSLTRRHWRRVVSISGMGLLLRSLMLITLYYAVGMWGFVFTPDAHGIPLVWPATGVGLAFVFLYGYGMLPAVGIASALITWQFTSAAVPLLESVGIVAATVAGVALGGYMLRRLTMRPRLDRLRDVWLLLSVGAVASSGLAALAGAWGMAVGMDDLRFSQTWWLCWVADLMGLVLVAPALITWLGAPMRLSGSVRLAALALGLAITGITTLVYSGILPAMVAMPLSYAVFPLIMLAAVRCPIQVTSGLILITGAIALSGTGWGLGPFADMGLGESLLSLNAQLALLVLTGLVLNALSHERAAAEARARQYLEDLARAGRLSTLGELSSSLAHELNQPLCALSSYAQACKRLLARGKMEDLQEALSQLDAGAHRAAETVRQMRAFAAGQTPEQQPVSPRDLVHPVLELLRPELNRRHIRLEVDLPDTLPRVLVVPLQVEQILINLLRNAMDAVHGLRPARIDLQVASTREGVTMTVTDTGPGIPPERLARLFDPFATWKEGGLGLGLSISRSLVEAHGGQLIAHNRPEGGAEFHFTLPLETHHANP
ncbi:MULTISPECIES: ATP-binding protein [unclassified Ectothiorhodospira]|uniref:ATP-binding protein n=1 Tax=unclassified Ectothiorhodospira TaxID=2684909 RepID=UPI001EE809B3|nr:MULTISPECIES: ATP-binding protein [unclassified Ectothiorhodospira]MCG5517330.1 ATP-binding protein [Ectothiorhodospira sp. 9100]MCG5520227.1 ATP-binding protein [Ectothiorhodospira sp. 9905]